MKDSTIPKESLHPYDILPPVSAASIFNVIISENHSCRSICEHVEWARWEKPSHWQASVAPSRGQRVSGSWWEWWLLVTAAFLITVIRKDSSAKWTGKKKFETRMQHFSSHRQMKCGKGSPPFLDTRSLILTVAGPLQWLLHGLWRCKAKAPNESICLMLIRKMHCLLAVCSCSLEKTLRADPKSFLGKDGTEG